MESRHSYRPGRRLFRSDFPDATRFSLGAPEKRGEPRGVMFRHTTRIQYADCTVGNHVYYGRYLDLLEAARGELFRSVGEPLLKWQERGVIFPVFEARLRYREAARYDDVVVIELEVTRLRKAFLDFDCRIVKATGALVVEAQTRHVCADLDERPRSLPPELITALQPHRRTE